MNGVSPKSVLWNGVGVESTQFRIYFYWIYRIFFHLLNQLVGAGTTCDQSLVQGVTRSGIRCDKAWYKVWQGLVQGVTKSGTRCDRVWYKVWQTLQDLWKAWIWLAQFSWQSHRILWIRYKINLTKFLSQKNTSFTISLVLLDLVVVHLECLLGFLSSMSLPCQRDVVVINKVT